ncbi:transporter substrate-binding domain-containing protein [Moraxella bovoculi]|uniref:transporter substrate-binding domain-containing protein n=1 Tax=Moraxella bovoculi TaxID=386891 RepID=UPI000AF10005
MKLKLLSTLALTALVSACGGDKEAAPTNSNQIRIATEGAYAPFNYTNTDGSLGGFDVDIANALCAKMAAECTIEAQDWDGIIPALKAGKFDAIVSSMSVTPERIEQVDFTEPYFANTLVFLAKKTAHLTLPTPARSKLLRSPLKAQPSQVNGYHKPTQASHHSCTAV